MSVDVGSGRNYVTLGHPSDDQSPRWSLQCWDTLDQVDHLILLPERALTMDSGWLQADLAEILAQSAVIGVPAAAIMAVHQQASTHERRRSLDWGLLNPGNSLVAVAPQLTGTGSPVGPILHKTSSLGQGSTTGASTAAPPPGAPSSPSATAASAAAGAPAATATAPSTPSTDGSQNGKRDERSRILRERQNEERQRKLEELRQQALATQKFREQQEEERRRRTEEQRQRDLERRTQVEERKKAILEAERERREALLRRSEDRGMRQEIKRRSEKSSIAFAFGSSTPRMLDPVDLSTSNYWGSRRATSTTNVMTTSVHARMMSDNSTSHASTATKRASSVFGLDHSTGPVTSSMYEVLHWDNSPPRLPWAPRAPSDGSGHSKPFPSRAEASVPPLALQSSCPWTSGRSCYPVGSLFGAGCFPVGDDLMMQSTSAVLPGPTLSGRRRRTDLMPTIPAHREGQTSATASRSSSARGSVSRTPGMSMSLSRLDQLARPRQRATTETSVLQPLHEFPNSPASLPSNPSPSKKYSTRTLQLNRKSPSTSAGAHSMSKSMSHLATTTPTKSATPTRFVGSNRQPSPGTVTLKKSPTSASTGQLTSSGQNQRNLWSQPVAMPRMTRAERLRLKARLIGGKRKASVGEAPSNTDSNGLRSGDVTPSSPTRPLSALSQVSSASTTVATIGHHVRARTAPAGGRKPRPVSIAVTGMSVSEGAQRSRSSRESISRDRTKEVKETENAKEREKNKDKDKEKEKEKSDKTAERRKSRPLSTPRQPRARSADMRESGSVSSASSTTSSRGKIGGAVSPSSKATPAAEMNKTPSAPIRKKIAKDADKAKSTPKVKADPNPVAHAAAAAAAAAASNVIVVVEEPKTDAADENRETPESLDQSTVPEAAHLEAEPSSTESEVPDSAGTGEDADKAQLLSDSSPPTSMESTEVPPKVQTPQTVPCQEDDSRTSPETTPSENPTDPQSQGQRKIISSEQEAKAALAEKRRLIREEKEREAERERLRLEEEQRLEMERKRQEELEQKLAEEEMERLAQEARKAEEERLQKAIDEARRREEEERLRREEEARQRAEKEQSERKAREEAERVRRETEERLLREEKERLERKKRVDAIMSRTRGKSGPTSNSNSNTTNSAVESSNKPSDLLLTATANAAELTRQPDLLGDLVNKAATPVGPNDAPQKTNGFHDTPTNGTASILPDISVITNADSVNSNTNPTIVDESVDLLA